MFPISIWQMILAYCIGPVGRQAHASSKGLAAQSISAHWSGLRHSGTEFSTVFLCQKVHIRIYPLENIQKDFRQSA